MLKNILITVASLASLSAFASPQLYDLGGKYEYFVTPACELGVKDQAEALNQAKDHLIKNLKELIADQDVLVDPVQFLADNNDEIERINLEVIPYIQDEVPFFRLRNLCPTATVLNLFGTGGNRSVFRLSVGGSATLSIIIQWVNVQRINKTNPDDIKIFNTFKMGVSMMSFGNLGVAAKGAQAENGKIVGSGEAGIRLGAGLIWGPMVDPIEFQGIAGGVSGTLAKNNLGIQLKGLRVINKQGKAFTYFGGSITNGVAVKAHINIGWIKPLSSFMGAVDKVSGQFLSTSSKEYKELVKLGQLLQ